MGGRGKKIKKAKILFTFTSIYIIMPLRLMRNPNFSPSNLSVSIVNCDSLLAALHTIVNFVCFARDLRRFFAVFIHIYVLWLLLRLRGCD